MCVFSGILFSHIVLNRLRFGRKYRCRYKRMQMFIFLALLFWWWNKIMFQLQIPWLKMLIHVKIFSVFLSVFQSIESSVSAFILKITTFSSTPSEGKVLVWNHLFAVRSAHEIFSKKVWITYAIPFISAYLAYLNLCMFIQSMHVFILKAGGLQKNKHQKKITKKSSSSTIICKWSIYFTTRLIWILHVML